MGIKSFALAASVAVSAFSTVSAPAMAATVIPAVFNFTVGSNNNIQDGNSRIFSATSSQLGTYRVRATGWSLETVGSQTYVRDSKLMVYDGGLGVISGDDGNGENNRHTIDNQTRKDFILLQFDRQVKLTTATFNTYAVGGTQRDSDATLAYGIVSNSWTSSLGLNNQNISALAALFNGSYSSLTSSTGNSSRDINPFRHAGNLWLIGADFTNSDKRIDGFKITNLAAIPEPATWAMMIGGFGMVGAAMRRRVRSNRVVA